MEQYKVVTSPKPLIMTKKTFCTFYFFKTCKSNRFMKCPPNVYFLLGLPNMKCRIILLLLLLLLLLLYLSLNLVEYNSHTTLNQNENNLYNYKIDINIHK